MQWIVSFTGDNQFNGDVKAIENGKSMFLANRVQAASILVKDDNIFFTGIVAAKYKSKVYLLKDMWTSTDESQSHIFLVNNIDYSYYVLMFLYKRDETHKAKANQKHMLQL